MPILLFDVDRSSPLITIREHPFRNGEPLEKGMYNAYTPFIVGTDIRKVHDLIACLNEVQSKILRLFGEEVCRLYQIALG